MQIAIYTHIYPTFENSGIEPDTKIIHYVAKEFAAMGHIVHVFYLHHWAVKEVGKNGLKYIIPKKTDYIYEGIQVHLIQYQLSIPKRRFPQRYQAKQIDKTIREYCKQNNIHFDKVFVHFPTFFTGVNTMFDGDSVIATFHLSDMINLEINDGTFVRKELLRYPKFGARNKSIQKELMEKFGRKSVIVHTGIEKELIAPIEAIEEKKQRNSDKMRIIYVGKLIERKYPDKLIEAVSKLQFPYSLEIIGEGPEYEKLLNMADGNENITITGGLPREEVMKRMYDADVFVMVSKKETYGLVYLEAMGQGTINIGSIGEGVDGIITDRQNGFLVNAGNVDEVVKTLTEIHEMPKEKRDALIDNGYKTTCDMTAEKTAEKYFNAV